jgi:Asp-tRNA(Asn)/Glu-tRNA(Gln) amidotransferase A subunit family amidase
MPHGLPGDLCSLTATQTVRLIRDGKLRTEALVEAVLDRVAAREPQVRALACFDPDRARAAATSLSPGPLHGVPLGVKDVLDTADMPTEYGSPIWRGWRPRADAAAVAWARAAGAWCYCKTVTTEFATRKPGPTANPHALHIGSGHTPGGSSSGSAAGVADRFFPLAFGTQTAGSVIRPAAYCGIVGYKPSFGLIHRSGMKLMSESLDTIGVVARAVADCALLAEAVSGQELGDPDRQPDRAPRIGLCRTPSWPMAQPETQALLSRVADTLARAGATVSDRELPASYAALTEAHPIVMNAESARALGWELAERREQISDLLLERLDFGLRQGPGDIARAYQAFRRAQEGFAEATEGLDVLVTPSAPGEAPPTLDWTGDPAFNFIWTSLHVPCVTVPAGTGPNGLPLGVQVVARRGEDRAALAWAGWVAAALG